MVMGHLIIPRVVAYFKARQAKKNEILEPKTLGDEFIRDLILSSRRK